VLFDVQRTAVAGLPALTVRGELDLSTAPVLAAAVDSSLASAPGALVIDLTPTVFLDSSGARELVLSARKAAGAGVDLHVLAPTANTAVRLPIDLLDLGAIVPVVGSAAELSAGVAEQEGRP
jgi:anti-sigma B factor antagonist